MSTALTAGEAFSERTAAIPALEACTLPDRWLSGGIAVTDDSARVVDVNEALTRWLEQPSASLKGRPLVAILSDRFPEWQPVVTQILQSTERFVQTEIEATDGASRQWFSVEIARHKGAQFFRLNSVLPPLVELEEAAWDEHLRGDAARRLMYVRLLRAEAQLDNLVSRWPGVIFSQRADFSFHFVSPKIEELTGVTADELRRQPGLFWQVVHEADVEELHQEFTRLSQSTPCHNSTYRIRHARTGRVTYVLEQREAVFSDNGLLLGYEGVWLDVTRQTIAENRLSSAAWKETLALLTMGLAHDFSNIMAGIHSLSEAFQAQVEKDHPFQEGLALIRRNSMQASQLVHRILNLHHGKVGARNYHDLNEMVADTVELMQKVVPRRIEIQTALAREPLPLYVDPVEFRQVLINLTLNAVDAMTEGGRLVFETSRHESPIQLRHSQGNFPRMPAVCLSVRDSGCGIPARHLTAVFDAFFTTKALNKGSGLGLYNARLFVEKHHGAVSVESTERVGTTFQVWLPQADFTEGERMQNQPGTQRHTVLLLSPPGSPLDTTAAVLRQNSFYVVVATSDDSAAELLLTPDYHFAAVIALIRGKDLNPHRVFADARSFKPPVKTVLQILGCNQDEIDTQLLNGVDLIISPDTPMQEIISRLKSLLDAPNPAPV